MAQDRQGGLEARRLRPQLLDQIRKLDPLVHSESTGRMVPLSAQTMPDGSSQQVTS
jgi:hypothetical protein